MLQQQCVTNAHQLDQLPNKFEVKYVFTGMQGKMHNLSSMKHTVYSPTLTSDLAWSKASTVSPCPPRAARCTGNSHQRSRPFDLLSKWSGARAVHLRTASVWPCCAAQWLADEPFLSLSAGLHPVSNMHSITPQQPAAAATCSGIIPVLFLRVALSKGSAPCNSHSVRIASAAFS